MTWRAGSLRKGLRRKYCRVNKLLDRNLVLLSNGIDRKQVYSPNTTPVRKEPNMTTKTGINLDTMSAKKRMELENTLNDIPIEQLVRLVGHPSDALFVAVKKEMEKRGQGVNWIGEVVKAAPSSHDLYIGMIADREASERYMKRANQCTDKNATERAANAMYTRQALESLNSANRKQVELQRRGEFENETIFAKMREASAAGKAWAEGLKVGDVFMGAMPAASEAGYSDAPIDGMGRLSFSWLFMQAALDVLDKMKVITDMQGKLVEYGPLKLVAQEVR